jgi:hypothetical protein
LKKGTDLSHVLFSDEFLWEKNWSGDDLKPSKMSNNSPSTLEWNLRFNKMVEDIAMRDVLIHTNHKDIFFISILKDLDGKRAQDLGFFVPGSKEGDSYRVVESKPYDRKGRERRFFDKDGKEIKLESEIESEDVLHAAIAEFAEKVS